MRTVCQSISHPPDVADSFECSRASSAQSHSALAAMSFARPRAAHTARSREAHAAHSRDTSRSRSQSRSRSVSRSRTSTAPAPAAAAGAGRGGIRHAQAVNQSGIKDEDEFMFASFRMEHGMVRTVPLAQCLTLVACATGLTSRLRCCVLCDGVLRMTALLTCPCHPFIPPLMHTMHPCMQPPPSHSTPPSIL